VQADPANGEAVKTIFTAATSGWSDSDEDKNDIVFAFYRFPLPSSTELTVDGSGNLVTDPEFSLPEIEWTNAKSDQYWTKLGGWSLRDWHASPEVPSFTMSAGNFFLVVRARDPLGGTSSAWTAGPMVAKLANLSDAEVLNALSGPLASNDADQILNSVSSVGESSSSEAQTQMLLQALETAVDVQDPGDESTQKVSSVVQDLVKGNASASMGPSDLARASLAVEQSIDAALALGDDFAGLSQGAGEAALGSAAAAVGATTSSGVAETDIADAAAATSSFESLISKIGQATAQGLEDGASQELSAVNEQGVGPVMALAKPRINATGAVETEDGLSLPSGWDSARRLDDSSSSCSTLFVQQTEWLGSNPFWWAPAGNGLNNFVAKTATVKTLELKTCDGTSASLEGVSFKLTVRLPTKVSSGVLKCAFYEKGSRSWSSDGVSFASSTASGMGTCESTRGVGAYTVIYWAPDDPDDPDFELDESTAFRASPLLPTCLAVLLGALGLQA